jgi:hypothetical protein
MAFKVFKPVRKWSKGRDTVTVGKGYIAFGSSTRRKYFEGIQFVELYVDEGTNRVGMKLLAQQTDSSYKLCGKQKNHLRCKDFLQHFNLVHDPAKQYAPTWSEVDKMLEIKF